MLRMSIQDRIESSLARSRDEVFVRKEFNKFGGYDQVSRALRTLLAKGLLVKAGYGVYVKARKSSLSGNLVPVLPLSEIGRKALAKLGVEVELGSAAKAYMEGRTTQMPMSIVVKVGRSRVSRKIGVGKQTLQYER